jgi:hypothetical protein
MVRWILKKIGALQQFGEADAVRVLGVAAVAGNLLVAGPLGEADRLRLEPAGLQDDAPVAVAAISALAQCSRS